jgi:hypothetical protein
MPAYTELLKGLRGTLLAALADPPDGRELNRFIDICHALAFSSIHAKAARGRLYQEGSRNYTDLAYDCIGDLFQRDEQGRLLRIKAYFDSFDIARATDEDLLAHLRRLVFSAVNQGLFRIYNDIDPAIGKILRNTKLAVNSLQTFTEAERLGEPCIQPTLCEGLEHLPVMELEILQAELARVTSGKELIPEILSKLSLLLRRQSEYARLVPLITLARAVRGLYAMKQLPPPPEAGEPPLTNDVVVACRWASYVVRKKAEESYVARKKVSPELLEKYFVAIDEYLSGKLDGGPTDLSLYESLSRLLPRMKKGEYNRRHRARVEYLSRQIERLALDRLRKG